MGFRSLKEEIFNLSIQPIATLRLIFSLALGDIVSKIEIDGFLSEESEGGRKNYRENYKDVFDLAKEINKFSMAFLQKLKVDWKNNHKLIIHTLCLRIIEHFQGTVLMLERGMMTQAKVLTRAMLEIVFILVALQKNPDLLKCYLDQHEDGRKKALKAALQFKNKDLRASAKKHHLEKHYVPQINSLKGKELNPLAPKQWAKEADLEDFYNLYYVLYSNSIHSNLSALDDHVEESQDEINLAFGPSDNFFYEVFQCCVYTLVNAINSTAISYDQDISTQLDYYVGKIKELDKRYLIES